MGVYKDAQSNLSMQHIVFVSVETNIKTMFAQIAYTLKQHTPLPMGCKFTLRIFLCAMTIDTVEATSTATVDLEGVRSLLAACEAQAGSRGRVGFQRRLRIMKGLEGSSVRMC